MMAAAAAGVRLRQGRACGRAAAVAVLQQHCGCVAATLQLRCGCTVATMRLHCGCTAAALWLR